MFLRCFNLISLARLWISLMVQCHDLVQPSLCGGAQEFPLATIEMSKMWHECCLLSSVHWRVHRTSDPGLCSHVFFIYHLFVHVDKKWLPPPSLTIWIDLSRASRHENRHFITLCLECDQIYFQGGNTLSCYFSTRVGVNVSLLRWDQKQKALCVLVKRLCQHFKDCLFCVLANWFLKTMLMVYICWPQYSF